MSLKISRNKDDKERSPMKFAKKKKREKAACYDDIQTLCKSNLRLEFYTNLSQKTHNWENPSESRD